MLYPIGIQDFTDLRKRGFVYVDKTSHIYRLAATGKYYFLSRPRRFGKSLLISTMDAYFNGRREVFEGLAIEQLEKEWKQHPVLRLDLNTAKYDTADELDRVLNSFLSKMESKYGNDPQEVSPHQRFSGLVQRAYEKTGEQVVILVDEYDKPLLQAIGNDELQSAYRATLKAFYSVLKTQDQYIRFAFLTGVTKFGKVSVFSDLNNLEDISMLPNYADICGITEKEIDVYFDESVREFAQVNNIDYATARTKLKTQYDGYHFSKNSVGMYNPFSLLHALKNKIIGDYWFETGTPTFLVELMKHSNYKLENLLNEQVTSDVINSIDSMPADPVPVIYQSGYLTIKGYNEEFRRYALGFPNKEVETGFINYLLPFYTPKQDGSSNRSVLFVENFVLDVRSGKPEQFLERLQAFFDDGDYQVVGKMELYFQNAMWVIFKLMGLYTEVERHTSRGRIDLVIKTADYIYIIELKLDGSAEEALAQIEEKGYAAPYATDPRQLYKIGINFSSATRSIDSYIIK